MPRFDYSGRDARGGRVSGSFDAGSLDDAVTELFDRGVTPVELNERAGESRPDLATQLGLNRPKSEDIMLFARQVYALTRSGVPLASGLSQLAASTRNPVLAGAIHQIRDDLEAGREFGTALARHPKLFSPLFVSLVRVGEASGRIDEAFERLFGYLQQERETITQIKTAVRYPAIVLSAIGAALWILMTFIIPVFANIFERFDAELPLATRGLLAVSGFFGDYWPYLLGAIVGAVFGFRAWIRTSAGRLRWDAAKLRIPAVGDILLRATLARFARAFSMASRSGVPILETLQVISGAVDNAHLQRKVLAMREGIERGESLGRVATRAGVFTPLVLQMIGVGEETGRLEEMMDEVAEYYEREVAYDVQNLSAIVEPLLTVAMAILVFLLALGVFLPMWNLGRAAMG